MFGLFFDGAIMNYRKECSRLQEKLEREGYIYPKAMTEFERWCNLYPSFINYRC